MKKLIEICDRGVDDATDALIDYEESGKPYWDAAAKVVKIHDVNDPGEWTVYEYADGSYLVSAIVGIDNSSATFGTFDELIDSHPDCIDYVTHKDTQ